MTGLAGLKDSDDKILKNKPALAAGTLSALFFILYGIELLQLLAAYVLSADEVKVDFYYVFITASYNIPEDLSALSAYIILFMPVAVSVGLIHISSIFLMKVPLGFYRYAFIIFQLLILGHLLIYFIAGAISAALPVDWNTDILKFVDYSHLEYPTNLLVVVLMMFIIILFVNFNARRVSSFINK